jgi:hypothetical protein
VIVRWFAVPFGALAVLLLVVVEVAEAFANIYSTAVSAQNLVGRLDRRLLAGLVGAVSTMLALVFDITAYESFLVSGEPGFPPSAGCPSGRCPGTRALNPRTLAHPTLDHESRLLAARIAARSDAIA